MCRSRQNLSIPISCMSNSEAHQYVPNHTTSIAFFCLASETSGQPAHGQISKLGSSRGTANDKPKSLAERSASTSTMNPVSLSKTEKCCCQQAWQGASASTCPDPLRMGAVGRSASMLARIRRFLQEDCLPRDVHAQNIPRGRGHQPPSPFGEVGM